MGVWGGVLLDKETLSMNRVTRTEIQRNNRYMEQRARQALSKFLKGKKTRKERKYEKRIPRKYGLYIKSIFWKNRKNKFYKENKKICFICGSTKYIQLNHLEYNSELFGNEPDSMLVALCKSHHEEFHALYGVKKKMYDEFNDFIENSISEDMCKGYPHPTFEILATYDII